MKLNKKLVEIKDYFIYGSGQIINLVAPLLVAPYIISVCGIEYWGKIGVAMSVFLICSLFIEFGSLLIGVKEVSINKEEHQIISKYLNTIYALRILLFLATILILLIIFQFNIDLKLYIFSLIVLLAQFFNPIWIYQGLEDFKTINKIIFISKAVYVGLIFLCVKKREDYFYVIFLLGLSNTIVYSYYFLKTYKKYQLNISSTTYSDIRREFKNTYPILISNLSISVYTNSPVIIVKYLLGDFQAGVYKIGDMLLSLFRSYLSVFFNVSFPKFCKLYSIDTRRGINYLKKMNILNVLIVIIISVVLYLSSIFYLKMFPSDIKTVKIILFCRNFLLIPTIIAFNIPFYQFLVFKNEQKALSKIIFVFTAFMLVCCYFLTLKYNINGTLLTIYFTEISITLSIIVYFYKKFGNTFKN